MQATRNLYINHEDKGAYKSFRTIDGKIAFSMASGDVISIHLADIVTSYEPRDNDNYHIFTK